MRGLAKEDREQLKLAHYMSEYVGYPLHTNTDAVYFPSGEAKFEALLEELKKLRNIFLWNTSLSILAICGILF
jgi:cardiolipin synthase